MRSAGSRWPGQGTSTPKAAWLEIAPGIELHLIEDPEFEPSPFEKEFGRHIALTSALADFPQLERAIAAQGAKLIEPMRETPFHRFFFRDPNGYILKSSKRSTTSRDRSIDSQSCRLMDGARSLAADPERIGNPVDVVEPGSDQRDLQNPAIVETNGPQTLVVQRRNPGRIFCELDDIIDHHLLGFGDRCRLVIFLKCLDECIIQGDPTQKLCV